MERESRNTSLDLLRVVSMFMILTVHFLGWGGAVNSLSMSDINYYLIMPIYFMSQIGNTLFFLLTGYFTRGNIRLKKMVFLERKTFFYVFLISLAVFLFGLNPDTTLKYVIKSAFPIVFNRYWFVSVYFILCFMAVPLHKGLKQCSRMMALAVIFVLLINNTFLYPANMTLMQGILAFIVGYYLREFKPFEKWKKSMVALVYLLFVGMYAAERIVIRVIGREHTLLDEGLRYVLVLLMAVMFFTFFEKLNIKATWPSEISGNIISVYLITACPPIVNLLYVKLIPIEELSTRIWFVVYYLVVNILLFALCIVIDVFVSKYNNLQAEFWCKVFGKIPLKLKKIQH
ncbi:MAG: acyltransferase family protein [Ruminococcus sp.]|nr:acyltransferase family protein [Ruminococcus sp.]